MKLVQNSVPGKCEMPGCDSNASVDLTLLGHDRWPLCSMHAEACEKAYDDAWRGWPDEPAHALAEAYRGAA